MTDGEGDSTRSLPVLRWTGLPSTNTNSPIPHCLQTPQSVTCRRLEKWIKVANINCALTMCQTCAKCFVVLMPFNSRNNPMTQTLQGFQGPAGMIVVTEVTIQLKAGAECARHQSIQGRTTLLFHPLSLVGCSQQYLLSRTSPKERQLLFSLLSLQDLGPAWALPTGEHGMS